MTRSLLVLVHAGVAALWLGSMAYSLFVVQPRLGRITGDEDAIEDAQRELASGNRWPVVGLIAALWVTGGVLAVRYGGPGPVLVAKTLLLAAASGLFWWISWRAWPRRVFARPDELPVLRARFRRTAIAMLCLVGAAYVLGVLQRG